ncbi:MAG: hypothetical protein IKA88_01805 [Clostridia bacterium]|nr:hypothetical protein [Clostridia bacterium]
MGKKKSVVLMVLLTIVIIALCAITALPSFAIPNSVKKWNPAVKQYDFSADLGGGYYAYYYPEGVISEAEYEDNLATAEDPAEYAASYVRHEGGLYLSTDEDANIVSEDGTVTAEFDEAFKAVTEEICARYEKKDYSDFRVSVVNDYALRIQLPASENTKNQDASQYVSQTLSMFALTGELSFQKGGETVEELKDNEIGDLIRSISIDREYEVVYLHIKFTSLGKDMIEAFKNETTSTEDSSSTSSTTLDVLVGEDTVLKISSEQITGNNNVYYPLTNDPEIRYVETLNILLNSALDNGGFDIEFRDVAGSDIRAYEPVYGTNTLTLLYIALAVVIAALIVFAIVRIGRYGVVNLYTTLTYFVATALCFAFINPGWFEVGFGTVFVFLFGLVLTNVFNAHVYRAIKTEFNLGKTVESSVKGGYKKTLWGMIDIYAVLLLGSIALLIGTAGLATFAWQAIICVVAAAFCNLLWARAINYVFLSASKNKFKYFRFVREDDDDE